MFKFTNDDAVLEELVKHLNMIVHIAAAYNFNEAVDSIIVSTDDVIRKFDENSFWQVTLLKYATQIITTTNPTTETTSPTTLFGSNKKALLAMKVNFHRIFRDFFCEISEKFR